MNHQLDQIVSRQDTNSAKWEFYHLLNPKADASTIPLWVADMDFPCSDEIVAALHRRVDRRIFGYSAHMSGEFFRSVCGWFQHRFGWYINSKDVMVSFGVVPALGCLVKILTKPGDNVLIQQPVYYPFMSMVTNNGRNVLANQLVNDGNGYYSIDFEDFEQKAALPETTLFILCSPHNPVGRVWTKEELQRMTEICVRHGVKIVSDEIHCDITRQGVKHYPLPVACPDAQDQMVICTAPSKSFNIAGLHASYIVATDEEIRKKWKDIVTKQLGMDMMACLSITATEAAYFESERWLDEVRAYIDDNLKFMKAYLAENAPRVKFRIPDATYLTWLDIRDYGLDSRDLWNELASDGKVLLENGTLFGQQGNGFIRLNAASPRPILAEAVRRFVYTVNRVRTGHKAPDFSYITRDGQSGQAADLFAGNGKTLLCFLRYAGCTVCQYDIHQLTELTDALNERGIKPTVILQSSPENANKLGTLRFPVICDPDEKLYKIYSIMPAIEKKALITSSGLDRIEAATAAGYHHGEYEGNENQLPALFVINSQGTVEYAKYLTDVDIQPALDQILEQFEKKGGNLQ